MLIWLTIGPDESDVFSIQTGYKEQLMAKTFVKNFDVLTGFRKSNPIAMIIGHINYTRLKKESFNIHLITELTAIYLFNGYIWRISMMIML